MAGMVLKREKGGAGSVPRLHLSMISIPVLPASCNPPAHFSPKFRIEKKRIQECLTIRVQSKVYSLFQRLKLTEIVRYLTILFTQTGWDTSGQVDGVRGQESAPIPVSTISPFGEIQKSPGDPGCCVQDGTGSGAPRSGNPISWPP
jgi:hypothetical protein